MLATQRAEITGGKQLQVKTLHRRQALDKALQEQLDGYP